MDMASYAQKPSWAGRIGRIALVVVVVALAVWLGALTLARYDVIPKMTGFMGFAGSMAGLALGAVLALLALVIGLVGKSGPKRPALMALVLAVAAMGTVYLLARPGMGAPPLHDITTNVDAPPQFTTLSLRADNLVPFASEEEWRAAHRAAHPDLAPLTLPGEPAAVLARARELAQERGWEIAAYEPANGHMEATAFAGYIRFRDDVIVDVAPGVEGGSVVNVRSVSRVGVGDLGYNAKRVREFLGALAQG
jgi:uncharacterized protein (DUF1499 family)